MNLPLIYSLPVLVYHVELWGFQFLFKVSLYPNLFSKGKFGLTAYIPEDDGKALLFGKKTLIFEIDYCHLHITYLKNGVLQFIKNTGKLYSWASQSVYMSIPAMCQSLAETERKDIT